MHAIDFILNRNIVLIYKIFGNPKKEIYLSIDGKEKNLFSTGIPMDDLKKISSLNYLGYIDLQKEIHNYDLLLSLSDHEGFSRVLLEGLINKETLISLL